MRLLSLLCGHRKIGQGHKDRVPAQPPWQDEWFEAMDHLCAHGPDVDGLPNGFGLFGRCLINPIHPSEFR